jgi:hypothetical protein
MRKSSMVRKRSAAGVPDVETRVAGTSPADCSDAEINGRGYRIWQENTLPC